MTANSPMMHRIRKGKSFSVPKKGRIRVVLLILVLIVAGKFGSDLLRKGSTGSKEKSLQAQNTKIDRNKEKNKNPLQDKASESGLSLDYVSSLLKNNPPHVNNCADTIKDGHNTLVLHYSLDSSLQELGKTLMNRYKPLYGAVVAINPNSGRILSLLSYKYDSMPDLGKLYLRSIFPAASVFKTITAAAAIEQAHYTANSLVPHVGRKSTLYKYQLEPQLRQATEIPFEEAYAFSINPVFARLGMYTLGKGILDSYEKRFGFNVSVPFELENEACSTWHPDSNFEIAERACGFNQQTTLSPLLGALIASSISEKGRMPKPTLVDSITLKDSCIYKAKREAWANPIKESTARELRTMMYSVSRYGTARKSFKYIRQSDRFNDIEYGGKTGSVDKDSVGRVDWFIGFARNPSDVNQRIAVGVLTVHGAYWTVHSSYIAAEYFRVYLRSLQMIQKQNSEKVKNLVSSDSIKNNS